MPKDLSLALFLGAGASVPYGKPSTRQLRNNLLNKYRYKDVAEISQERYYLYSMINFPKFEDVEHILQCIKEIDDFFSSGLYGARYLLEREYKLYFQDPRRPWELSTLTTRIKNIRRMIEDDMFENYSWDHTADNTLVQVYDQLFNMIKRYSREIHVFTTNYDKSIEEYCSKIERNCRCIDGFIFDEYSNRRIWQAKYDHPQTLHITNIYLYKLHGSLNWKKHKIYGIEATNEEARSSDPNYVENLVVYPSLSPKDGAEIEPYKTIREKFRNFIEYADLCIVIGFSFRDEHINTIFSDFLRRGKNMIMLSPSADKNVYANFLKKDIPEPENIVHANTDKTKAYFRENQKIVTINQALTSENLVKIIDMIAAAIDKLYSGTITK